VSGPADDASAFELAVLGAGVSGLCLARAVLRDEAEGPSLVLFDGARDDDALRTLSFWAEGPSALDDLVTARWQTVQVVPDAGPAVRVDLGPYEYRTLFFADLQRAVKEALRAHSRHRVLDARVEAVEPAGPRARTGQVFAGGLRGALGARQSAAPGRPRRAPGPPRRAAAPALLRRPRRSPRGALRPVVRDADGLSRTGRAGPRLLLPAPARPVSAPWSSSSPSTPSIAATPSHSSRPTSATAAPSPRLRCARGRRVRAHSPMASSRCGWAPGCARSASPRGRSSPRRATPSRASSTTNARCSTACAATARPFTTQAPATALRAARRRAPGAVGARPAPHARHLRADVRAQPGEDACCAFWRSGPASAELVALVFTLPWAPFVVALGVYLARRATRRFQRPEAVR
jgi:hypothetical protein